MGGTGVSEKDHTTGVLSQTSSSILADRRSGRRVFAHNTNRAGPYSHMSSNNRRIRIRNLRHSAALSVPKKKLQHSPRSVLVGQSATLLSHCVPIHAPCCHPYKQPTSTWERSRASQPAPPPPTEAEVTTEEVQREDGLLKWFPNRGPGTSSPLGGSC